LVALCRITAPEGHDDRHCASVASTHENGQRLAGYGTFSFSESLAVDCEPGKFLRCIKPHQLKMAIAKMLLDNLSQVWPFDLSSNILRNAELELREGRKEILSASAKLMKTQASHAVSVPILQASLHHRRPSSVVVRNR
jgi:hypothetical protein